MGNKSSSKAKANNQEPITKTAPTESFQAQDAQEVHNIYRNLHGMPKLNLNKELCDVAQISAETFLSNKTIVHNPKYGQNIFWYNTSNTATVLSAKNVVENWYNEYKDYSYETRDSTSKNCNFTQMIWKSTVEFGIAAATDAKGVTCIVAYYSPPGNVRGSFRTNVLAPKK